MSKSLSPAVFRSTRSTPGPAATWCSASFASETDPAVLRLALRVQDREGYWWVECSGCECGWQVSHFAESVG
jgi:hypothetical protein